MTIKEKPLINAVSRLGPLPSFLFSNPVFTGMFALLMCPVFGATFFIFQVAGRGEVNALELFEAARWGAIVGVGVAAIIFTGIAINAYYFQADEDERQYRLTFVLGGLFGIILLMIIDRLAVETLRDYFGSAGPLI